VDFHGKPSLSLIQDVDAHIMCQPSSITGKAEPRYLIYSRYTRADAAVGRALLYVSSITGALCGYSIVLDGRATLPALAFVSVSSMFYYSVIRLMATSWQPKTKTQKMFWGIIPFCIAPVLVYLQGIMYDRYGYYIDL
jgi:hypothetical protein